MRTHLCRARGKAAEQSAERSVSRPSTTRGDDERVVKMAHADAPGVDLGLLAWGEGSKSVVLICHSTYEPM